MAYTKILTVSRRLDQSIAYARNKDKTSAERLKGILDYVMDQEKIQTTCFETALNCDVETAYADMMATKKRWGKETRKRKGYHIIQSFSPGEVTPTEAHEIGVELANRAFGDRYEVIITTHLDQAHLHNHIVFNSVSFTDGTMYRDRMTDYYQGIRGVSDEICKEHGLSVIEPTATGKQYSEWQAEKKGKTTARGMIRADIDRALAQAYTYETFLKALQKQDYEVKTGVKHTAVKPSGSNRFFRLDSLGDGYTEQAIKERLERIQNGEKPLLPSPDLGCFSWRVFGRRYRIKSGRFQKARKLTGFQALCFKYLYLLRKAKSSRPNTRTAAFSWQDVRRFEQYQRQFLYLHRNRIETEEQLSMLYDALQAEIDALTEQRAELYRQKRKGGDVEQDITAITQALRPLRRELRLCVQIEESIPKMKQTLQTAETEKQNLKRGEPKRGYKRRSR